MKVIESVINATTEKEILKAAKTAGKDVTPFYDTSLGMYFVKTDLRKRIRDAMEANGIKQYILAAAVGQKPQAMSDFMCGRRALPFDCIEMIFAVLGL